MNERPQRLALVTGGFRRVGAAIAAQLAAEGYALALHGMHNLTPDPHLLTVLATHHTDWAGFAADLAKADDVAHLLPAICKHFGRRPDLIINNASLFSDDTVSDVTAGSIAAHHAVNVAAPVLLATQLSEQLGADERACVINILDQRIAQPHGDQLSYTLSKQALFGATQTLARALAPKVRVNAVAPGLTLATPDYTPEQIERLTNMMPLELLPQPTEVADAVLWLAKAPTVTGQTLFVDGGAHMVSYTRDFVHLGQD